MTRRWGGYAGFWWALAYVPIHVYWAFGGSAAFLGLTRSTPEFALANWGACVVIVGAALVSLALVRDWGRLAPRWALQGTAWIGAVAGILHWAASTTVALTRLSGPDWWNLLVFEPWFLLMGIFLIVAAIQNLRLFPRGERSGGVVPATFLLGGLIVVLWGVYTFNAWLFLLYGPAIMLAGLVIAWAAKRITGARRSSRVAGRAL
ncbi:DUF3995 domain-containing protein [Fodinicola acaciae]|uniref:DUF3995 domain-containing protein n=1 Tax=Fodinicola acaciae TaxID=2681555 RepID=UPI0013D8D84F|nr:DUF3995 domain-containing protein [Fodinicola acaciae]